MFYIIFDRPLLRFKEEEYYQDHHRDRDNRVRGKYVPDLDRLPHERPRADPRKGPGYYQYGRPAAAGNGADHYSYRIGLVFILVALAIRIYEKYGTFDITKIRRLNG